MKVIIGTIIVSLLAAARIAFLGTWIQFFGVLTILAIQLGALYAFTHEDSIIYRIRR